MTKHSEIGVVWGKGEGVLSATLTSVSTIGCDEPTLMLHLLKGLNKALGWINVQRNDDDSLTLVYYPKTTKGAVLNAIREVIKDFGVRPVQIRA